MRSIRNNWTLIAAAMLITLGCLALLFGFTGAGGCFAIAALLYTPRSEFTRPMPRGEVGLILGLLIAFAVVLVVGKHVLPYSVASAIERFVCHPVVVVLFWLLMLRGLYLQWKDGFKAGATQSH